MLKSLQRVFEAKGAEDMYQYKSITIVAHDILRHEMRWSDILWKKDGTEPCLAHVVTRSPGLAMVKERTRETENLSFWKYFLTVMFSTGTLY